MNKNKKAFTLVELIVVITILAILGTIAFISLQGYSATARDSTRISNLSAMKTSLELFYLDVGKYPNTTSGFDILYSGATVWTQGTFGEDTKNNSDKLDKIPKDPLTNKEYTYSITKTKQEYELAGITESNEITLSNNILLNQTNAGETIATAVVVGNYNGALFKTEIGGACEILSVPSIVSSEPETSKDLITILNNKNLVFNGFNNLPSNYTGGKYKTNGGFNFKSEKLVVYSDTQECKPLYEENPAARIKLIKNLQTAYSGTIIGNNDRIKGLIAVDTSDSDAVTLFSKTLVNNNLGGKITTQTIVKCELGYTYQNGECITILPRCEAGYTFNTIRDKCEIAPACVSGYTFNTIRDKCEAVYTCNSGYTYNTTTKLCGKLQTVAATTGAPTTCKGTFTGSSKWGKLEGNGLSCNAAPGGECSYNGSRYKIKFYSTCIVERWSRDNNWRYNTVAIGSYGTYTSSYEHVERLYNQTVGSYSCPSGYTLSGSTCSRTLTTTPICSNGGIFNTTINLCQLNYTCSNGGILNGSIDKCQLAPICDNGILNTSLDACVEN